MFKVSVWITSVLLFLLSCGGSSQLPNRPNIILVIIDTLRADHLGCYGYERNTSPNLDSLAENGMRWSRFQAQAPWTLPSTASIFTGLSPRHHGTYRRTDADHGLHAEVPTIPVLFTEAGYETFGIFNVVLLNPQHGFDRGFETYSCDDFGVYRAAETVDEFLSWLGGRQDERPYMAIIHIFDVHQPYDPPSPFDTMFFADDTLETVGWEITEDGRIAHPERLRHYLSRYDGGIAWVDSQLGRLFLDLRRTGQADSTIIMVTADHGEEFLEWGWVGHGGNLYQEMLHVPLIISGPGIESGVTKDTPCGQFDILPTMLDICSIQTDCQFDGVSVLEHEETRSRVLPSSELMFPGHMLGAVPLASVLIGDMKGVVTRSGSTDRYYMYDLAQDPHEQDPIEADPSMEEALDIYRSTPMLWDPEKVVPDENAEQALEDLGYI
jgi:arylsulfatase A-like enzyme